MIKIKEFYFHHYFRKSTKAKDFERSIFYLFPTLKVCYIKNEFETWKIQIVFIDIIFLWFEIGVEFEKEDI